MKKYLIETKKKNGIANLWTIRAKNKQQAETKLKALFFFPSKISGYLFCLKDWVNSEIKFLK